MRVPSLETHTRKDWQRLCWPVLAKGWLPWLGFKAQVPRAFSSFVSMYIKSNVIIQHNSCTWCKHVGIPKDQEWNNLSKLAQEWLSRLSLSLENPRRKEASARSRQKFKILWDLTTSDATTFWNEICSSLSLVPQLKRTHVWCLKSLWSQHQSPASPNKELKDM